MDFIFMLTRNDRTIEDAAYLVDAACDLGVRHIGFKDVGVPFATMQELAGTIRRRGGVCYLEVVSTTPEAMLRSLEAGRALGVDRMLGGTDLDAAQRILGDLSRYFPFPGRPVGHPTRLGGSRGAGRRALPRARARMGCGGVDLLAYRATEADPLDLVRAAREALAGATADRRRQRELDASGSTRSPKPASMRSRSARRCSTARSRRPRDRSAARSSTSSRPATRRPRWRRERAATAIRGAMSGRRSPGADALDRAAARRLARSGRRRADRRAVKAVRIERSLRGIEADLVAPLGLGRRARRRQRSRDARRAGRARRARARRRSARSCRSCSKREPHADARNRGGAAARVRSADALVAVGSGTINDLCKFAAAQDGKPYVVFATAPSMNGYTSMNAAITVDGHKKSLPAATPLAVFMDLEVLAAAPARMIRAGLGDSLCRPTAQADWLLSHHLLGTPYRSAPFAMLAEDESIAAGRARGAAVAAISTRCARSRARSCCPASA